MAKLLRLDVAHPGSGHRRVIGLLVNSRLSEVTATLVAADGRGLDAEVTLVGVLSAAVARETFALFSAGAAANSHTVGTLATLRAQLAELQAALVTDLLATLGVAADRVAAIGVHDPGIWQSSRSDPKSRYVGLCDAAGVAESTGLNVIDAFPARDLAQNGQGGPVTALAEWMLLKDPARNRALLDLGRTVRLSYLPATAVPGAAERVLSFDVGPGTALLDLLVQRLTDGQHAFDPGGRFSVQGRRIPELVEHWLADPYFDRPIPRWHPRGVRPERFLGDALQMAVEHGWSVRELLCSATHFIAETIALALRGRLPDDAQVDEIVVTGGGQHNGMLLREIGRGSEIPLVRASDLGIPPESLGSASVGVLALLHLDQVPGNPTAVTGTEVPRLLGRLTPGSPQNWQRLLSTATGSTPPIRPLRSAGL